MPRMTKLDAERGDERVDPADRGQEPVGDARARAPTRERRRASADAGSTCVRELGGDDPGEGEDRADGEVEAAGDDDERAAAGDDPDRRPLVEDVEQVRPREERRRDASAEHDEQRDEADDDAVVAQEPADAASCRQRRQPRRDRRRLARLRRRSLRRRSRSPNAARMTAPRWLRRRSSSATIAAAAHHERRGARARAPPRARRRSAGRAIPVGGELDDQLVDRALGADVDAARRLVGDQQPRRGRRATWRTAPSAGCRPRAPPTRVRRGRGGRDVELARSARAVSRRSRRREITPPRLERRRGAASVDVLAMRAVASAGPASLRSSGSSAIPRAIAPRVSRRHRGSPSSSTVPAVERVARRRSARASSVRPLPTRPARPTISPARTSKRDVVHDAAPRRGRAPTSTTGASSAGDRRLAGTSSSQRAPEHRRRPAAPAVSPAAGRRLRRAGRRAAP